MICDTCHEREAVALVGNLETGDQTAFCFPDFARFGLDLAKRALDPGEILAVLEIPLGGIVNGEPAAVAAAPKTRKGRKAKPEPEPEPVPAEGVAEIPAAPADE